MFGWGKNNPSGSAKDNRAAADADLVRAARTGDKRAFVEIVARHQAMVVGIALGVLGDFAASEDAGQEAFLTAWRKLHELREPERLRPWLAQIARNAALGYLRRRRGHDELDEALAIADEAPLPNEVAANEEEAALVRESLAKLPETYRLPLVLFYREGQSVAAVAQTLGISDDAVKQRLARGREMLRDRMSGLVEDVLTRTRPTAVFTMTIAVAIGALAAPSAIAAAAFTGAAATTATSTASPLLTAMSTTKTCLITAAVVAVACVPIGYHLQNTSTRADAAVARSNATVVTVTELKTNLPPNFENSALFAEWRQLHETYGNTPDAMPAIYKAIADMKDAFRRRAFRSALISEWVQLDPTNGLRYLLGQKNDTSQRRQFFEEWLSRDATNAVAALMASGAGWESVARDSLKEIARQAPGRIPEIVPHLPKPENNFWDTKVRDAFAVVAEGNLPWARAAAEKMTGPNRDQALSGIAQVWAKSDLTAAIEWAKKLPEGTDREEVIRSALLGKAAVDPVAALPLVGLVPPGGRSGYFATTTGARVLREAAAADFDATVAWVTEHPSRFGHEDMMGLASTVTDRLNADPVGFLARATSDNSLKALMPAIDSAILNDAGGQRATIWEWLKTQPVNDATESLRREVLSSAGYQDPALAMKLAADIPRTKEGDKELNSLAMSLWNGGQYLGRFDKLVEQAPERLRGELIESAFRMLNNTSLSEPQTWVSRIAMLPESSRALGTELVARAWAGQEPEAAVNWVSTLPANEARSSAVSAITGSWAANDAPAAATWVAAMQPGLERDRSAQALALSIVDRFPNQAWDWAMSINDLNVRVTAAEILVQGIARRDPSAAQQFINSPQLTPELKARLEAATRNSGKRTPPRS